MDLDQKTPHVARQIFAQRTCCTASQHPTSIHCVSCLVSRHAISVPGLNARTAADHPDYPARFLPATSLPQYAGSREHSRVAAPLHCGPDRRRASPPRARWYAARRAVRPRRGGLGARTPCPRFWRRRVRPRGARCGAPIYVCGRKLNIPSRRKRALAMGHDRTFHDVATLTIGRIWYGSRLVARGPTRELGRIRSRRSEGRSSCHFTSATGA
jgi:hypothetical protein